MRRHILRSSIALTIILCGLIFQAACSLIPGDTQGKILPALKDMGLKGKLIFILNRAKGNQLLEMDLSNGSTRSLLDVPDRGHIGSADISPDGKQIVMSYAPPPPGNDVQYGVTDLYLLATDGSGALQQLTKHQFYLETFYYPVWSPDGQTIYFTHSGPASDSPAAVSEVRTERMQPGGKPELIFHNSEWPMLSPDGIQVAYLATTTTGTTELYLGGTAGSASKSVLPAGLFSFVDAHFFSRDGKKLIFSAPSDANVGAVMPPAGKPVTAWTFGITPVYAHTLPSDWYQLTLADGQVKRLASLQDTNMVGAFSPDGDWIAFVSLKGVFVMKPDGSGLTQIASLMGINSLNWIR